MGTVIWKLEEGDPNMQQVAVFTLPPKEALVAYIKQNIENNYNTWEYPEIIKGMRESDTLADHWYYDVFKQRNGEYNGVLAAYPESTPLTCKSMRKRGA